MMESLEQLDECSRRFFLSAGETDAQGRMPLSLVIERSIEIATEHANRLGIGYDNLIAHGIGWVLTRISVHMLRYPTINEHYTFTTWIESINRLYSDRCFLISDNQGNPIGHVRSMWVAIDMQKRTVADLTQIGTSDLPISKRECPVPKPRKFHQLADEAQERHYTFLFSDIDFNRHVNTVQYVRLLLNEWSVDFFDHHYVEKCDVAFHQECYYGDTVAFRYDHSGTPVRCEIVKDDGVRAVAATFTFSK